MQDRSANPFTRAILKQVDDPELRDFVVYWDSLEFLVVRVFRAEVASQEDEAEHNRLRSWLSRNYGRWQARLTAYWRQTQVAGQPTRQDPFLFLIAAPASSQFVGNWTAMQYLPAAREALNQFLIDRINSEL
jgi:hypothetical protein